MSELISKKDALAFRERWRLVNEREIVEMREASLELKLQQFNTLLAWGQQFDWPIEGEIKVAEVRARWLKLRKAFGCK